MSRARLREGVAVAVGAPRWSESRKKLRRVQCSRLSAIGGKNCRRALVFTVKRGQRRRWVNMCPREKIGRILKSNLEILKSNLEIYGIRGSARA